MELCEQIAEKYFTREPTMNAGSIVECILSLMWTKFRTSFVIRSVWASDEMMLRYRMLLNELHSLIRYDEFVEELLLAGVHLWNEAMPNESCHAAAA